MKPFFALKYSLFASCIFTLLGINFANAQSNAPTNAQSNVQSNAPTKSPAKSPANVAAKAPVNVSSNIVQSLKNKTSLLTSSLTSSDSVITFRDTLWLTTSAPGTSTAVSTPLFLQHRLKRGQTLYQLAAFFKVSVEDLKKANPVFANGTANSAGHLIYIPITKEHLIRSKPSGFSWKTNIRVLFRTKTETLYRVAKGYLDMPVDSLKARNRLTSDGLPFGKILNIGWVSLGGVHIASPADTAKKAPLVIPEALKEALIESERLKTEYLLTKVEKKEVLEKGIAYWDNQDKRAIRENKQLFALHRTAPIGSTIRIYNPMFRRTLFIKIIGRIPNAGYTPDIMVVLSPYCAKTLGAIDARFHVELHYLL
ncbi:MAG: hypothetical protein RI894_1504 [Bacteroidota bacterium]